MLLDDIIADVWSRWERAIADRKSPLHTPCVATVDADGVPQTRIMVLRAADRGEASLRFHTDARSGKCTHAGPASVLGYDPEARIQLRLTGTAMLEAVGPAANAAWAAASLSSRRCYLAAPGPGTTVPEPTSGLPANLETRLPSPAESDGGRANFAVVLFTADHIDWLHLAATGHRRAQFVHNGSDWHGRWVIP
ncbi:MAG: pyridoxamine 5'-phosphate oxidase family protein [Sphingomonadaceae bacterium]